MLERIAVVVALIAACRHEGSWQEPAPRPRPVELAIPAQASPRPPTTLPAPGRIVAIGDLHGDVVSARAAFRLAGAMTADEHWSGGSMVIVQTGDVLDRGDGERAILALTQRLEREATAAGGRVLVLNGNHEIMNVEGDFRYVTSGGFADFAAFEREQGGASTDAPAARAHAFRRGGPFARMFAAHNVVQVVGDTVFAHAGLLPEHVRYGLERINREVRDWLLGSSPLPELVDREDSPVWIRRYAMQDDAETCALAAGVLAQIPAARMVIGHTVQDGGIRSACDGRVWRIDVGLARLYGGPMQALEIRGDSVRVLQ